MELDQQAAASQPKTISVGPITFDLDTRLLIKHDQTISLRHKEFELLSLLMSKLNIPVTRVEIFDQIWVI